MHVVIANPRWRGKRPLHPRPMRNPQFSVSAGHNMLCGNTVHTIVCYCLLFVLHAPTTWFRKGNATLPDRNHFSDQGRFVIITPSNGVWWIVPTEYNILPGIQWVSLFACPVWGHYLNQCRLISMIIESNCNICQPGNKFYKSAIFVDHVNFLYIRRGLSSRCGYL